MKSTRDYLVYENPSSEAELLPKDGSEAMKGVLNMANHSIINLKDPVNDQDAANTKWIITQLAKKLDLSGGNMAGDINLVNSHKIINSPNPSSDTDLITKKYMETHVSNSHVTSSDT